MTACAAQYEPELFPGLIYRMKEPKVVLLIFVSGKVVLTGDTWRCIISGMVVRVCGTHQPLLVQRCKT